MLAGDQDDATEASRRQRGGHLPHLGWGDPSTVGGLVEAVTTVRAAVHAEARQIDGREEQDGATEDRLRHGVRAHEQLLEDVVPRNREEHRGALEGQGTLIEDPQGLPARRAARRAQGVVSAPYAERIRERAIGAYMRRFV